MLTGLTYQTQVEGEVVYRGDLQPKDLVSADEVVQVSQAVLLVDEGRTLGIDRAELLRPLRVADIDRAVAREELAVAPVAGRHDAVKHIDTAGNVLQQVDRRTDAHQVAGLVLGEDAIGKLNHLVHLLRGLPDGKATDGIPFSAERSHEFGSSRT